MSKYYGIKSFIVTYLFLSIFILSSFLVVKNTNAKEYQTENRIQSINSKYTKNTKLVEAHQLEIVQNMMIDKHINKKKRQPRIKRGRKRQIKTPEHNRRFLEGGPTHLRVPSAPAKKSTKKDSKQPLMLPTWTDHGAQR